jgi:eukaryotic translation initiation factor 2C
MLINVDISTGTMYKAGSLLALCCEYVGKPGQFNALAPKRGFPDRERLRLQRFISGIRIITTHSGPNGEVQAAPRVIKKLSTVSPSLSSIFAIFFLTFLQAGANDLMFTVREGEQMSVAQYFQRTQNKPLQYPDVICAEVGSGALIPLGECSLLFLFLFLSTH